MRSLKAPILALLIPLMACATAPKAEPDAHAEHGEMDALGAPHEEGGPLVHRFTEPEAYAESWESPERAEWQRPVAVVEAMDIRPGQTVADIGTGTGYFLPILSAAVSEGGHVLALDIEPSMIAYVEARKEREGLTPVVPRVVPMDDPQLPPAAVDRVLIVNTWHHIPDRVAYLAHLKAGLAPGGALYIVDFKVESSHGPPAHHRLSPAQVMAELEAGGLVPSLVTVDLPEQYMVRGTLPPGS